MIPFRGLSMSRKSTFSSSGSGFGGGLYFGMLAARAEATPDEMGRSFFGCGGGVTTSRVSERNAAGD
jgi:hypothetical protein